MTPPSNVNQNSRGSSWRKWDLHVHTPDSIVNHYGDGDDIWDKLIKALAELPSEYKVLGINDSIFLDGYKKVLAAKSAGKLPNIELLLPVIELRLDKFGGSKNDLSKVNYHIMFSNELTPETIESQFLSAHTMDCTKPQSQSRHHQPERTGVRVQIRLTNYLTHA
jgi:hypothetical protein